MKQLYRNEVAQALQKDLNFRNPMDVPAITKVVVNIGMGESLTNPKAMENAQRDLTTITGQHPIVTKAKKSIAAFKIRQGMPIGLMVTLRGSYMYEFLDRLINIALPRIRDFRGAPTKGFDGRGNYTLGMREHIVFPEIDYNAIDRIRGLQITIVTTAKTDDAARRLLTLMGLVFSKDTEAALA
ncbi:50S ribosomal protein L5 [Dehalococcoidia bacterium]|nr:50S ribosomal protein L5 [Dehalococcoidia bacterium]